MAAGESLSTVSNQGARCGPRKRDYLTKALECLGILSCGDRDEKNEVTFRSVPDFCGQQVSTVRLINESQPPGTTAVAV
jgi:hypothetical protein